MNKRIGFTNNGGFPLTQYTLDWMQASYRNAFMGLAGFFGDKFIVSGMDEVGGNVTNGWLSYGGELIPFVGGAIAADIVVIETPVSRQFEDNLSHDVYFEKVAQFGGPATFAYADLVRRESILSASGEIKMWSGLIAKIPSGWALADGATKNIADYPKLFANISNVFGGNGTTTFALPNLKSKFIVGYDAADADYNAVGNAGGVKVNILTAGNMPILPGGDVAAGSWGLIKRTTVGEAKTINAAVDAIDSGNQPDLMDIPQKVQIPGAANTPVENRPPFFTLAYIIKL